MLKNVGHKPQEATPHLYKNILTILVGHLGPSAKKVIDKQIRSHLKKRPEQLHISDMPKLLLWLNFYIAHIVEDNEMFMDLMQKLHNLAGDPAKTELLAEKGE